MDLACALRGQPRFTFESELMDRRNIELQVRFATDVERSLISDVKVSAELITR
jgi:hypothetical protein